MSEPSSNIAMSLSEDAVSVQARHALRAFREHPADRYRVEVYPLLEEQDELRSQVDAAKRSNTTPDARVTERLKEVSGKIKEMRVDLVEASSSIKHVESISRNDNREKAARRKRVSTFFVMVNGRMYRLSPEKASDLDVELNLGVAGGATAQWTTDPRGLPVRAGWRRQRVLVEPQDRFEAIFTLHGTNEDHAGGITKVTASVWQHYYWSGVQADVTAFLRACPDCWLKANASQMPRLFGMNRMPPSVMSVVQFDHVGPIGEGVALRNGVRVQVPRYLFVIVDRFSRYCELYAVKDRSAALVVQCLNTWVQNHGSFAVAEHDNAPELGSGATSAFLATFDALSRPGMPRVPQCQVSFGAAPGGRERRGLPHFNM
jgi:hypothetical protein